MLDVANVSCQKGFNILFSQLSFYLKAGEIGRVSGANGRGKTSLLKILAGISSFEGNIAFAQAPIGTDEYKEQILYIGHQSLVNPQLSVLENLIFLHSLVDSGEHATPTSRTTYTKALNKVGLAGYINERTHTLSAGQKRRIILAILFITNTKLWLLDEPFTALDVDMVVLLEQRIREFCHGGGVCVFTTHQATTLDAKQIEL